MLEVQKHIIALNARGKQTRAVFVSDSPRSVLSVLCCALTFVRRRRRQRRQRLCVSSDSYFYTELTVLFEKRIYFSFCLTVQREIRIMLLFLQHTFVRSQRKCEDRLDFSKKRTNISVQHKLHVFASTTNER